MRNITILLQQDLMRPVPPDLIRAYWEPNRANEDLLLLRSHGPRDYDFFTREVPLVEE